MAIGRVYFNQDLRPGVDGLVNWLLQNKMPVPKGENMALFINNSRTIFKLLAGSGHMVTYKSAQGRINIENITDLAGIFAKANLRSKVTEKQIKNVLGQGAKVYSDEDQLRIVG